MEILKRITGILREGVRLNPEDIELTFQLSEYLRYEQPQERLQLLKRIVELDPLLSG